MTHLRVLTLPWAHNLLPATSLQHESFFNRNYPSKQDNLIFQNVSQETENFHSLGNFRSGLVMWPVSLAQGAIRLKVKAAQLSLKYFRLGDRILHVANLLHLRLITANNEELSFMERNNASSMAYRATFNNKVGCR